MIRVDLDVMLARRKMSLTELSQRVGITMANLSILKNGRAKAVRFETLEAICRAVLRLVESVPDLHIVYPVHLNPAVRGTVYPLLGNHARIHLTDPIDLRDTHNFMARCRFVMTDSGGIQEEATALGVPTLVLRRETERGEGVETGILKLVGVEEEDIFNAALELAENDSVHDKMSKSENPYGDGHACEYIADAIAGYFNSKE